MSTLYSVLFLLGVGAAVVVCIRRPFAGLLLLAGVSPFYTLLRESSVGSPIFFVWPYLLTAVLVLVMMACEVAALLTRRGAVHPWRTIGLATAALFAVIVLALEADAKLLSRFFTDTTLASMGTVLSSTSFTIVAYGGLAAIVALAVALVVIMRRREGRLAWLDVAVAAFILIGVVSVLVTYARNGILFTGLNGFRYYFAGALVYLPARYFIRSQDDERAFLRVVIAGSAVGACELLLESVVLNTLEVPPQRLPWVVGHLAAEFGYQPEGGRTFFEGRFVPMGFMYMTHMSGLFLLLGYAIQVPRALAAPDLRRAWSTLAILALLVLGAHWTSRTVLLLIAATYVVAALSMPVTWRRRFAGAVVLAGALVASAELPIPGARYDLAGEVRFLSTRAVPNLVQAIVVDVREIAGWGVAPLIAPGTIPDGWVLMQNGTADRRLADTKGRYILDLRAIGGIDLRNSLPDWIARPGERIYLRASILAREPSRTEIQLYQGERVETSESHAGDGEWHDLEVDLDVIGSNARIGVDIDVSAGGAASVRDVTLTSPRGTLVLLGRDRPCWIPAGWRLVQIEASTERVIDEGSKEAAVRLTAGTETAALRYLLSSTEHRAPATITARIRSGRPVTLHVLDGDRILRSIVSRATGQWETLSVSVPSSERRQLEVGVAVPAGGEMLLADVTLDGVAGRTLLLSEQIRAPVPTRPPSRSRGLAASGPPESGSTAWRLLFGRGAEFGMWNQVFFASQVEGEFAAATYSDMKYLEFAQQFGLVSVTLLAAIGVIALWQGWYLARRAATLDDRAHLLGLTLMVLVTYVSLVHLPSLFRVGYGTVVFVAMAILPRRAVASSGAASGPTT